tara:strand:+ start:8723 stop:9526 length:804 start_codon:yes stop_codon:yes gene_type:complete
MHNIDWKKHSSFLYADQIQKIMEPLDNKLNINYFSYIKQFNNKSRIVLTNFPKWNKFFCESQYYLRPSSFVKSIDIDNDYSSGFILGYKDKFLADIAKNKFNLDRGISVIYKRPDFCEFFHFGTVDKHDLPESFYLDNLSFLKKFILYFREQAFKLFEHSDLIKFTEFKNLKYINNQNKENNHLIKINKLYFYIGNKLKYFTKREVDCIIYLLKGLPAKTAADKLNISKRTYDAHIENIKFKLVCNKNSEIIFIIATLGLLSDILQF